MRFVFLMCYLLAGFHSLPQEKISRLEVERIVRFLASDSMKGRANGSTQLMAAAQFIASEFEKDSLLYFPGYPSFLQPFLVKTRDTLTLYNVVAVLEGKSRPQEVVIFSAHYDHIGMERGSRDSIFNGANDNASGTTALLMLAHYFAAKKDNSRTLVFCAFAGEELGLKGSEHFVNKINSESVVAMINIEMIGARNAAAKNSFFLTGARHSNLERILRKNLKGSSYRISSEPFNNNELFERSDNWHFALKGIPAHSLMCSDDNDRCYHNACDEITHLDLENMTNVIKAIAISVKSIVDGTDTPGRIRY